MNDEGTLDAGLLVVCFVVVVVVLCAVAAVERASAAREKAARRAVLLRDLRANIRIETPAGGDTGRGAKARIIH